MSDRLMAAAKKYAEAKRAWAEVFLFYYNQPGRGGKPRTVAEATAMADVEVDVITPMAEYEGAKLVCQSIHLDDLP